MTIHEIEKDERLTGILGRVKARTKLRVVPSHNSYWGAEFRDGVAEITFGSLTNGVESFAHELLHIDMQLKGYRRITVAATLSADFREHIGRLVIALDNELQHHRMFPGYVAMGFDPAHFYADEDADASPYLFDSIKVYTAGDPLQPLLDYLTIAAPGGAMSAEVIGRVKIAFGTSAGGSFKAMGDSIEGILTEWKKAPDLDCTKAVSQMFRLVQGNRKVWIGFRDANLPDDFPAVGFFTSESFTVDELNATG